MHCTLNVHSGAVFALTVNTAPEECTVACTENVQYTFTAHRGVKIHYKLHVHGALMSELTVQTARVMYYMYIQCVSAGSYATI